MCPKPVTKANASNQLKQKFEESQKLCKEKPLTSDLNPSPLIQKGMVSAFVNYNP